MRRNSGIIFPENSKPPRREQTTHDIMQNAQQFFQQLISMVILTNIIGNV